MISKRIIAVSIAATISTLAIFGFNCNANAQPTPPPSAIPTSNTDITLSKDKSKNHACMMMMAKMHQQGGFMMSSMWNLGLFNNKHLTPDEAKIIAQAALLMYNRRDLKIASVTPKMIGERKFYVIKIVDAKGNDVSTAVMNSDTGMIRPLSNKWLQKQESNSQAAS